ncbi:hypothetical protein [Streptomyces sp. NPDC101237]
MDTSWSVEQGHPYRPPYGGKLIADRHPGAQGMVRMSRLTPRGTPSG